MGLELDRLHAHTPGRADLHHEQPGEGRHVLVLLAERLAQDVRVDVARFRRDGLQRHWPPLEDADGGQQAHRVLGRAPVAPAGSVAARIGRCPVSVALSVAGPLTAKSGGDGPSSQGLVRAEAAQTRPGRPDSAGAAASSLTRSRRELPKTEVRANCNICALATFN